MKPLFFTAVSFQVKSCILNLIQQCKNILTHTHGRVLIQPELISLILMENSMQVFVVK